MQYDDKLITLDNLGTFKGKMEGEIDKASHDLIADEYDATKTYNVGDVVLRGGFLYECNTAIGTAEEWDPTKWTQVKVTELGGNGGVIEVDDYASLPTVGEAGIIYITKDTNKQYRYDATNGYVELNPEEIIEVYDVGTPTSGTTSVPLDVVAKALRGKAILKVVNVLCSYRGESSWTSNATYFFRGENIQGQISSSDVFGYVNPFQITSIHVRKTDGVIFGYNNNNYNSIAGNSFNAFNADVTPSASGKRVARELNLRKTQDMITPNVFDTTATYAVGDVVIYQNQLYQCHTAVETAGAWTGDTNWTNINVIDYVKDTERIGANVVVVTGSGSQTEALGAEIEKADGLRFGSSLYWKLSEGPDIIYFYMISYVSKVLYQDLISYTKSTRNLLFTTNVYSCPLREDIAPSFSATDSYVVGDLVWYNKFLYRCIVDHNASGWNSNHFQRTTVADAIKASGGSGGVIEVDDYASLPTAGEVGNIYITKDTNRQYRWTGTAYVELSAEDEVEVVEFYDGNVINLTEAQLKKLYEGKLALRHPGLGQVYSFVSVDTTSNKAYFRGFFTSSQTGSYVDRTKSVFIDVASYNLGTKVVTRTSNNTTGIEDDSRNFFASNVDPVANGKRLVREQNIYGKIIPTYSSSDAGKVVRVNSSGTGVELDETATELEINRLFRTKYTITSTITNGSASGDKSIWVDETASVTIAPSSGYVLPTTITVSGATYSYDNSTGIVSLSAATGAVSITAICPPPPPNKGDIITLDGGTARYRVLKTNGNVAEVLALDDVASSVFNSSSVTTTFPDGSTGQKYEGSTLDSYMNSTFYNSLSANIKAAIVQKAVTQSIYQNDYHSISGYDFAIDLGTSGNYSKYWFKRKGQVSVGNRYCYALDLDDVAEYLGAGSGNTVSSVNLNDMFFEQTTSINKEVWLDSAVSGGYSTQAYFVTGNYGCVFNHLYYGSRVARPAFQVDLSKVSWSKE